jgi:hypothetical protein
LWLAAFLVSSTPPRQDPAVIDEASPGNRTYLVLLLLGNRDITNERPDLPQVPPATRESFIPNL